MTTVRDSVMGFLASAAVGRRCHVGAAVGLQARPSRPDPLEVGTRLAGLLVEAVGVIDLCFGIGVRTGHRRCQLRSVDDGEAADVDEVGDVDDGRTSPRRL